MAEGTTNGTIISLVTVDAETDDEADDELPDSQPEPRRVLLDLLPPAPLKTGAASSAEH